MPTPPRRKCWTKAKQSEQGQGDQAPPLAWVRPRPAPAGLGLGGTVEQVTAAMGQPKQIVKLGAKQIYRRIRI